mmetsp:Transcript_9925/g.32384  ORF Transcript_9925/g.32384 Transcript_9925/m.32384 type:complete len:231 (+) Transcript_9925:517-1209(+)
MVPACFGYLIQSRLCVMVLLFDKPNVHADQSVVGHRERRASPLLPLHGPPLGKSSLRPPDRRGTLGSASLQTRPRVASNDRRPRAVRRRHLREPREIKGLGGRRSVLPRFHRHGGPLGRRPGCGTKTERRQYRRGERQRRRIYPAPDAISPPGPRQGPGQGPPRRLLRRRPGSSLIRVRLPRARTLALRAPGNRHGGLETEYRLHRRLRAKGRLPQGHQVVLGDRHRRLR